MTERARDLEPPNGVAAALSLAAHAFTWGECCVLLGIQCFWVLIKSAPLGTDSMWCLVAACAPFALLLVAAASTGVRRFNAGLLQLEWLLHLSVCVCYLLLVLGLLFRDPFHMRIPFTWMFYLWTFSVSFLLLANLARHQRRRHHMAGTPGLRGTWLPVVVAVLIWAVLLMLASAMTTPVYFWMASLALHAVMIPYSRWSAPTRRPAAPPGASLIGRAALGFEAGSLIALVLFAQLLLLFDAGSAGTLEAKAFLAFRVYLSPLFVVGAAVCVLAWRYRLSLVTDALAVVALACAGPSAPLLVPLCMGYALPALYRSCSRQGALGYAVSAVLMTAVWLLGMTGFTFAGLTVQEDYGLALVRTLMTGARVALPALFGISALLAALGSRIERPPARVSQKPEALPALSGLAATVAYLACLVAVLLPAGALVAVRRSPPLRMQRPARIPVDEPSGLCHAGYSQSDEEYATLARLGCHIMRVDFAWRHIQPSPDTWNWERWDRYLDAAERHGQKVLALLDFDNNNVETSPAGKAKEHYIAPQDLPLFLEYVTRTVARYKDRVFAWEIWNEPNLSLFWRGPADEFYPLARRTADAARAVDPALRIVGTAMCSPMGIWTPGGIEAMHATGALARVDHPSFHVYASDPRTYYNEFMKVIAAARKHRHPGALWITELGDPDGGAYPWRASSDLLADHVIKAHVIATSFGIERLVWYCHDDSSVESQVKNPMNSEAFFGLLDPEGQWKPAAHAYRLFSTHCSRSEIRSDLVHVSGGLAARQLRSTLYRRSNGDSALVLWYEPALSAHGGARVRLDLGGISAPALVHDVYSPYTKRLLDGFVDVFGKPVFITYNAQDPDAPVNLVATGAVYDALLVVLLVGGVLVCAGLAAKRCGPHAGAGGL